MGLDVRQISVLSNNYVYLVRETESGLVAIVDPAEDAPVRAALADLGWTPTHILNTHHHADHTGGNLTLKRDFGLTVVGPKADSGRIPGIDVALADGDSYAFGAATAKVFDTPGHTRGHIAYWFEADKALFSGDTLFALGCGRLFEGTPQQMWTSLQKLRALPDDTTVYCAHEYTQSNADFALSIDGDNAALKDYAADIKAKRAAGKPTVPSPLGLEKRTNPFLRADDPALAARVGLARADSTEVFREIRARKDSF
ncbi:MAG: hydroxyacylglutathione hydrolase [Alphaproteobacteria bacterium]|nr:hydroxyacylglutathione hydrolase [Alphaproteobacteria bacterium]